MDYDYMTNVDQWEPVSDSEKEQRNGGEKLSKVEEFNVNDTGSSSDELPAELDAELEVDGSSSPIITKEEKLEEPFSVKKPVDIKPLDVNDGDEGSDVARDAIGKEISKLTVNTNLDDSNEKDLDVEIKHNEKDEDVQSPSFINNMISSFRSYSQSSGSENPDKLMSPNSPASSLKSQDVSSPNIISHRRQSSLSNISKKRRSLNSPTSAASPKTTFVQNPSNSTRNSRVSSISSNISVNSGSHSFKDYNPLEPITTITSETSNKDGSISTELYYNPKKFVEEKYLDTQYHYASKNRDSDFHTLFASIPKHDRLIDDFSSALSREFLYQGRIYITETHLGFNSNILGWTSKVIIAFKDITYMEKTSAAGGLFPNAISIETSEETTQFNNFISRDRTFGLIKEVWSRNLLAQEEEDRRERNGITINTNSRHPHSLIDTYSELIHSPRKSIQYTDSNDSLIDKAIRSIDESPSTRSQSIDEKQEIKGKNGKVYNIYKIKPTAPFKDFDLSPYIFKETESFPLNPKEDNNEFILAEQTLNCTPNQAFQIFFNNDHPIFLKEFLEAMNTANVKLPQSFKVNEETSILERTYSYDKFLSGIPGGAKSTVCLVSEEIIDNDPEKYIMVINTTRTPNVPSGGSFSTKTRYMFKWGPNNNCNLVLSYWVEWTGSSWIKSMVEAGCKSGQKGATEKMLRILHENIDEFIVPEIVIVENDNGTESIIDTDVEKKIETNDKILEVISNQESKISEVQKQNPGTGDNNVLIINILLVIILILLYFNWKNQRSLNKSIVELQKMIIAISEASMETK